MNPKQYFTRQLIAWHTDENTRSLPWKGETDPYKIWLSEIMLQQTRAEQGLKYYLDFTANFPTISDLAAADNDVVFRMWQGLGYYNRCRNMLETARFIAREYDGEFPGRYEDILALKGVGTYTAAAIASFAFQLPYAVVDGNVYRVLSRYFGIEEPIDSQAAKKLFPALAQELLDVQHPAAYNQAIMDLGAVICTPRQPACPVCPLRQNCIAFRRDLVNLLPVKQKKVSVTPRFFSFFVLEHADTVWIQQRTEKGIWQGLHQFYLVELEQPADLNILMGAEVELFRQHAKGPAVLAATYRQRLTHQLIESRIYRLKLTAKPSGLPEGGIWVPINELTRYAFPKTLVTFLKESGLA